MRHAGRRVTDITLAPRNARGRVEFSSDFVVLRPRDPAHARHTVLLEIPNRGLTQANGSFFSTARGAPFDLMNLSATTLRDAFLFEQGFTVAWLGWEFDLPKGSIGMEAPAANVNGPVRQSLIVTSAGSHVLRLGGPNSYCAADAAQPGGQLLVKSHFDEPGRALPRADWAFARIERDSTQQGETHSRIRAPVVLMNELQPGQIYELGSTRAPIRDWRDSA